MEITSHREAPSGVERQRLRDLAGWRLAWLLFAVTACWPGRALAQTVAEGRELYFDAEFRPAIEVFTAALARGNLTDEEVAEAQVHLAALRLLEGDEARAREHVVAALIHRPDVRAPEGAPATLQALLDEARARLDPDRDGDRWLSITGTRDPGGARVLARIAPGLADLVAELMLRCRFGGETFGPVTGPPPQVVLSLPGVGDPLRCEARGVGRVGVELLRAHRVLDLDAPARRRISPWVWVGLGLGVAVVAVAVVLALALPEGELTIERINVEGW